MSKQKCLVLEQEVLRHVRLDQTKITYEVGVFIHLLQPKLDANSQLIMNI